MFYLSTDCILEYPTPAPEVQILIEAAHCFPKIATSGEGGVGGSSGTNQLWSLPGVKHWLRQSPEFEHPVEGSDQRVDNVLL